MLLRTLVYWFIDSPIMNCHFNLILPFRILGYLYIFSLSRIVFGKNFTHLRISVNDSPICAEHFGCITYYNPKLLSTLFTA